MYIKTSQVILEATSFLDEHFDTVPRKLRIQCFEQGVTSIPRCPITNEICCVTHQGFAPVCKRLWKTLVCFDKQTKVPIFSWLSLLKMGISESTLIAWKSDKFLHRLRKKMTGCKTIDDVRLKLLSDGFQEHAIDVLVTPLRHDDEDPALAIKCLNNSLSHKNNTLEYYLVRGSTQSEARQSVYDQCNSWAKIKECVLSNPDKYAAYCESRLPGLRANNRISKFESELVEKLRPEFDIQTQVMIRIPDVEFEIAGAQKRPLVDVVIDDSVIVEYNGSYWHSDFIKYDQFTRPEYEAQIARLALLSHVTKKTIVVLWEHDLKSVDDAIQFINEHIDTARQFTSTRDIDDEIFRSYITLLSPEKFASPVDN